jgi:protoporphyrinogen oxidase
MGTQEKNSLHNFIEEKTGPSYYNDLFASFIKKKTCAPGNKIHRDWFLRTDRDIENRKETPQKAYRLKSWYYPTKGFEVLPQKLWEKYRLMGGETICNCGDISFEKTADCITRVTAGERTFSVKDVVWTASINELNVLLGAKIPPVEYLDTLLICLTYNRKKRVHRPFIYTYHPQEDLIFNRVYYPDHIFGNKNLPDREGICLELNDFVPLKNMSDDEIIARAVNDVEKLGLFRKSELRRQQHFWLKECMPVYGLDYEVKLEETFKAVRCYRNVYSVGRKGGYFFCQTPAAVSQGLKIAKHLLAK